MKRFNLIAARIQAGYGSQPAFVDALKEDNVDISYNEYANIEGGRRKDVGIGIGLVIAQKLNREHELATLFLPLPTYKIRLSADEQAACREPA